MSHSTLFRSAAVAGIAAIAFAGVTAATIAPASAATTATATAPTVSVSNDANGNEHYTVTNHTSSGIDIRFTSAYSKTWTGHADPGQSWTLIADMTGTNNIVITSNGKTLLDGTAAFHGQWSDANFRRPATMWTQTQDGGCATLTVGW